MYFGCVFGAGFLLGPLRVLFLEPKVGTRTAELIEAPLMFIVIVLVARWIGRTRCRGLKASALWGIGVVVAGLILAADLVVGIGVRGMTMVEVFTHRDPVAGPIYYGLVAFTAMALRWFGRPGFAGV